jgi:hypothetical protein
VSRHEDEVSVAIGKEVVPDRGGRVGQLDAQLKQPLLWVRMRRRCSHTSRRESAEAPSPP